ncbi:MAG: tetratricopeptide repeat protein [Candidatus Omnitrophica bacterium]|nr:tetratricopeptide repeat protein [Candidatus Omnitrophota bacterium]
MLNCRQLGSWVLGFGFLTLLQIPALDAGVPLKAQRALQKNNSALSQLAEGNKERAVQLLTEAHELDPHNVTIRQNLVNLYLNSGLDALEAGQYESAHEDFTKALEIAPTNFTALNGLGQVHYQKHELEDAKIFWGKALALKPEDSELSEKLGQLNQEIKMDSDFRTVKAPHFDIRTEKGVVEEGDHELRRVLNDTYRHTSQDMQFFTQRTIIVLIYSQEAYHELASTPHWSGGLFDGKIRIPIPDERSGWPGFEPVIRHEFTHALIWEITRGACPPWLNEGLAQYEERGGRFSKMPPELLKLVRENETQVIPMAALNNPFARWEDLDLIRRGYAKSESLVRYIIQRYGLWKIHNILALLGKGEPMESAVRKELALELSGLEADWVKAVKRGK